MSKQKESSFDVTTHRLVPKHSIVPEEEAEEIIEEYGGDAHLFPHIQESDPVAEALKAEPGDLIRVTRQSETANEAHYYRLVVR